jgi:hypothetical protein
VGHVLTAQVKLAVRLPTAPSPSRTSALWVWTWLEMYIGGNGGIKTEVAQFLIKVKVQCGSHGVQRRFCSCTVKTGTWSAP